MRVLKKACEIGGKQGLSGMSMDRDFSSVMVILYAELHGAP